MPVVSKLKARSTNLINTKNIVKAVGLGIEYINEDVKITQQTSISYNNVYFYIGPIDNYKGKTLTFKGTVQGDYGNSVFYAVYGSADSPTTFGVNGSTSETKQLSATVPEEATGDLFIRVLLQQASQEGSSSAVLSNLQLEEGTTVGNYKPYYLDIEKFNSSTIRNININGTDYHFANKTECDGNCECAVNEPLIDLKVSGNSIQGLPEEYQQVEYIESSGTQYINTGVIANQDTSAYVDFQYLIKESTFIFGSRISTTEQAYTLSSGNSSTKILSAYGTSSNVILAPIDFNRHTLRKNKYVCTFDDTTINAGTASMVFTTPGPLYLFACYQTTGPYLYSTSRIFEFKLWQSDRLVRDMVPCYRKEDNVAGFYDLVEGTFYTNKGSGSFSVGTNIYPTPERPIKIQGVGERTKNLFDIPDITGSTKDTTINCYITSDIIASCQESPTSIINTSGVETSIWRISYTRQDGTMQYTVDDTLRGKVKMQVVKATEDNPIVKIMYRGTYIKEGKYSGIQIEYGETQTDYEPYGYKIPIRIQTKNLFDYSLLTTYYAIDNFNNIRITGGNTTGWVSMNYLQLKPLTTYTLSFQNSVDVDIRTNDLNVKLFRGITTSATFITDETGQTKFKLFSPDSAYPYYIGWIQLEEDSSTTYPITHNIYLKEPLRKIGDYADYIDYKNKKVIRNVGSIIYNGTESWSKYDSGNGYLETNTIFPDGKPVLCNMFVNTPSLIKTLAIRKNYANIYVYGVYDYYPTQDEWHTFLKANNMEVIGQLVTPTEETIDIPEILLEKGLNNITIATSVEANIQATYWKQI